MRDAEERAKEREVRRVGNEDKMSRQKRKSRAGMAQL